MNLIKTTKEKICEQVLYETVEQFSAMDDFTAVVVVDNLIEQWCYYSLAKSVHREVSPSAYKVKLEETFDTGGGKLLK